MAIFFSEAERAQVSQTYDALPEPKPSREDFYTYAFEQGVSRVCAKPASIVMRDVVGAADARDRRKRRRV